MPAYDLVIRNGEIVDGSGGAPYKADLALKDGVIAKIGRIAEAGASLNRAFHTTEAAMAAQAARASSHI